MRLNDRELKLLAGVEKRQSERKRRAWSNLAAVSLFAIAVFSGIEVLQEQWLLLGPLTAFAVAYLANVYFAVRPEDKLVALLQRYVNQDPEAVVQIAESATASESSTDSRAAPTI